MKKIILIAVLFCIKQTSAQTWVTVPDANFVHYLDSIVPAAMHNDSLNISHALVTTTTRVINVSSKSISNLSGVQYFSSLDTLNCGFNSLTSLPALPNSLIYLYCGFNTLTSLPTLPNSLVYLICSHNSLAHLPSLPNSLRYLYCQSNSLTSLPALPDSLIQLYCMSNSITCFPTFPDSITFMNIDPNPYNCLPNHIIAMSGADKVKPICGVGNSNGCPAATSKIDQITYNNNEVVIYPNPATNILNVEIKRLTATTEINIVDVLGNKVESEKSEGMNTTQVDINNLQNGIYFVVVTSGKQVTTKKVIIYK